MSAYALPGSLFPPLGGAAAAAASSSSSLYSPPSNVLEVSSSRTRSPQHHFAKEPKKQHSDRSAIGYFSLDAILSSSTNSPLSLSASPTTEKDSCSSTCNDVCGDAKDDKQEIREAPAHSEVGIQVTEARIDPVRLVQAVTSSTNCKKSKANTHTQHLSQRQNPESSSRATPPPHQDAIQFELSISFNGRNYSATRTFPRILKLRHDLIRELNYSARKRAGRRRRKSSNPMQNNRRSQGQWRATTGETCFDDDDENDNDTVATVQEVDDDYDEQDFPVLIPEIPECDTDSVAINGGNSVAGRGFAMLQALLGPYCPAIERWLRNVMVLVPPTSSPSLSDFLWEPVSVDHCMNTAVIGNDSTSGTKQTLSSPPSLQRIAEDCDREEEDYDDDEADCCDCTSEEESNVDVSSEEE